MSKLNHPIITILGVEIDNIAMNIAAKDIVEYSISKHHAAYVTKPYVEFLDLASSRADVQDILNNSLLTLPDSVALQWAALYLKDVKRSFFRLISTLAQIVLSPKKLQTVIHERFAGADFCWLLLETAAAQNASIYLIGHPQGSTIANTATTIQERLPNIQIVGTFDGYDVNTQEDTLISELIKLQPNLILVGIGFPRQERLMARLAPKLTSGVLIGEGGTFDYESFGGKAKRAPYWMRKIGLEWLWRLLLQPKRIRRQLAIPRFIWKVYRSTK